MFAADLDRSLRVVACNAGSAGSGCETSEVCADGLLCGVVVGGELDVRTCGECVTDADCDDGLLCAPDYEIRNVTGTRTCVPPGSRLDGEGCDVDGSGDSACASGNCAEAAIVFDYGRVGLCGACDADEDCPGSICVVPDVEIGGAGITVPHCS